MFMLTRRTPSERKGEDIVHATSNSGNKRQRCRLIISWSWRRFQGFGCSPIKMIRELGSDRSEVNLLTAGQSESHEKFSFRTS